MQLILMTKDIFFQGKYLLIGSGHFLSFSVRGQFLAAEETAILIIKEVWKISIHTF